LTTRLGAPMSDDFFDESLRKQRDELHSAEVAEEAENDRLIKDEAPAAADRFVQLCLKDMETAFAENKAEYHIPMWVSGSTVWDQVKEEFPYGHLGITDHEPEILQSISKTTRRVVRSGGPGNVLKLDSSISQKHEATQAIIKKVLVGIGQMKAGKIQLYEGLSKADQDELKRLYPEGYEFVEPHDVASVVKKSGDPTWEYSTRPSSPYAVILPEEEDEKGKS
jgi:hypothetical protein